MAVVIRRWHYIVTAVACVVLMLIGMIKFSQESTTMKPMALHGAHKYLHTEFKKKSQMLLKLGRLAVPTPLENKFNVKTTDDDVIDVAINVSRAQEISRRVKVACFITTQISALESKLRAVNNTWATRMDKIFYVVTVNKPSNISFPNILPVNIKNDREHLTEKSVYVFKYLYNNHLNDFDWFMKADDDSYVIVENLKYLLSHFNSSKPVYLGHHFKLSVVNGYMSGGGTYILNRAALKLLIENGYNVPGRCRQQGGSEDVEIGRCVTESGGLVYSSLDNKNRETFHALNIFDYVNGPIPGWIKNYARNKPKSGKDCCSQLTISFHYISPELMTVLDALLYRISVYGRQLDYKRLPNLFSVKTVPPPGSVH